MKKSLVFAMAMALGVSATAFAANPFSDLPAGHWAYGAVILGEGSMTARKDEAVATFPIGIVRIMLDEMLVQSVGDRRQGDGGTRVAVSRTLNRVGRQDLGHLDGALVQLGLLEFGHGLLSFQLVGPRIRLVPSARRPHIAFSIVAM